MPLGRGVPTQIKKSVRVDTLDTGKLEHELRDLLGGMKSRLKEKEKVRTKPLAPETPRLKGFGRRDARKLASRTIAEGRA